MDRKDINFIALTISCIISVGIGMDLIAGGIFWQYMFLAFSWGILFAEIGRD